jgi:hypothetical protein
MKRNSLELHKILLVLLAPEYVGEALKILLICSDKWYDSFIEEINKKSYNTACMAIDFAYNQLVEDGILIKSDNDKFGVDL